jgi:hypothetical protein
LKVVIIGQHPVIQPGFCGVMSLNEARWLSHWGHEVELVIPFRERAELDHIISLNEFDDLNELPKLGEAFDIRPIFVEEIEDIAPCDVLIWQVTDHAVWDAYFKRFAAKSRVATKNFPKTAPVRDGVAARNMFSTFDYAAFALKEDVAVVTNYKSDSYSPDRYGFVGRGADPELFHPNMKSETPFIAVDVPNTADDWAIAHFVEPLERLRDRYPDLQIVSLGRSIGVEGATHLDFMPYDQLAEQFINPAWVYCFIDYAQSAPHVRGTIHKFEPLWRDRAIYEVQNIEAQMAGAVMCGYDRNIIAELHDPQLSATFPFPSDSDAIYQKLCWAIENQTDLAARIRARTEQMHDWKLCISRWEAGLRTLLESGYDRNAKKKSAKPAVEQVETTPIRVLEADIVDVPAALDDEGRRCVAEFYDAARVAVEFGIGGSTRIAAKTGVGHLYSVETDPNWIEHIQSDPNVQALQAGRRVSFIHADVGAVKEWGYPVQMSSAASDAYLKGPWSQIPVDEVDFVLVDGRFRVATTVNASLRTDDHVIYAVDDYGDRSHYEELEELFDVVRRSGRVILLKKGRNWSLPAADAMLAKYRMDPR